MFAIRMEKAEYISYMIESDFNAWESDTDYNNKL